MQVKRAKDAKHMVEIAFFRSAPAHVATATMEVLDGGGKLRSPTPKIRGGGKFLSAPSAPLRKRREQKTFSFRSPPRPHIGGAFNIGLDKKNASYCN